MGLLDKLNKSKIVGKFASQAEREAAEDLARMSPMVNKEVEAAAREAERRAIAEELDTPTLSKLDPNQDLHTPVDSGNLGEVVQPKPQEASLIETTVPEKAPPVKSGSVTDIPEMEFTGEQVSEALSDFKKNGANAKNSKILQWIKDNPKKSMAAGGAASVYGINKLGGSDNQQPPSVKKKEVFGPPSPKKEEQPDPVKDLSEEEKSVKEELAQLKAEDSAPKTSKSFVNEMLKAEGTSLGSDANLKEAQSKRDQEHAANTFGRAADTLSGALLHTGNKLDKFYSEQDEFANRHVSDIKDRIANEKNDPGSAVSDAYRKILGEFGVKIEGPISAAAVEKIAPWVEKKYLAEEARKARIEELKIRQQELKANKEVAKQEKQVKINSDKTAAYRKEIDKNTKPLQDTYDNRDQIVKFLEEAIKNPVGGGFQDAAITYGFIKSRDNSAVREGEMKMLAAAGSVPDRLRREFSKAMSGQAYNSQDMKDLIAVIRNENAKLKNSYSNRVKSVLKQAEKEGLDLTEVNPRNDMYSPLVNQEQLNQEAPESKFTQGQEAGIARVMQNNKISREEAIKALKQAGKL